MHIYVYIYIQTGNHALAIRNTSFPSASRGDPPGDRPAGILALGANNDGSEPNNTVCELVLTAFNDVLQTVTVLTV